jgi:hypothetical protein
MNKAYCLLFSVLILTACGSNPTEVEESVLANDAALLAPPLGDSQLEGLCTCSLDELRDYVVDVVPNGCDTHEVFNRDKVDTLLMNCIDQTNKDINDELTNICTQIDSFCAVGYYYAKLQESLWKNYQERIRYLMRQSNEYNHWIISALVIREKERLIYNSQYYDNLIKNVASKISSLHITFQNVYNDQRNKIFDCIQEAQAEAAKWNIDCLEFNISYVDHN